MSLHQFYSPIPDKSLRSSPSDRVGHLQASLWFLFRSHLHFYHRSCWWSGVATIKLGPRVILVWVCLRRFSCLFFCFLVLDRHAGLRDLDWQSTNFNSQFQAYNFARDFAHAFTFAQRMTFHRSLAQSFRNSTVLMPPPFPGWHPHIRIYPWLNYLPFHNPAKFWWLC